MTNRTWWKESVVYQIYPRSFCDSNGDGIGDLRGIIGKLDYLKELGIDVVWLSPVYRSPNDDNGYDISDYQAIMEEFGTLADWEELLAGMHARGIKLLMDLVVNHSSDEHAWFVASRSSKENPYRDFYIWRPGKNGREPNNWESFFSGPAWEYDAATDEYYLHLFSPKQPDLNWENPAVRTAIFDMMRWWLDKGIDGFRMDVINLISKAPGLPDIPGSSESRYHFPGPLGAHGPRLLEFLGEMKRDVLAHYDIMTVGEMPLATTADALAITDQEHGSLNMLFQFEHMGLDTDERRGLGKWARKQLDLRDLKHSMTHWQKELEGRGWNSLYLSNHDQPRALSRFGDDGAYRVESAKMLATFLHTLQGTPYIYQGEEIGMTNVRFASIDDYNDIETLNIYREFTAEKGLDPAEVLAMIYAKGRDNARTPMQWDASPNAGFSSGIPWLKINPNYTVINAQQALADPNSIFYYYQQLIRLRKVHPIMAYGTYDLILPEHEQIYAYTRTLGDQRLLVVLNFSAAAPTFHLPSEAHFQVEGLLISNYPVDAATPIGAFSLRPYEARMYHGRRDSEAQKY
ncbi:MAG TPA: alpha-glucosidase [Roseiflexaceae bacterium]|nr:alpha-glucosidase [Roseiflexaceae bacterium]